MPNKLTKDDFISKVNNIHQGNILVRDFTSMKKQIEFKCTTCGNIWRTNPSKIIYSKQGYPFCKKSTLENEIRDKLIALNIDFVQSFKDIWLDNLPLDFYLLMYNVAIECQGEQHYRPIKWFGGDASFTKQQERDNKNYNYASNKA